MKRTVAIVTLGLLGLTTTVRTSAQLERHARVTMQAKEEHQANAALRARAPSSTYQGRETWYEFLLRQFNPNNFDYGAWMEERRQLLLNESVRNSYFMYSAGVTLALLLMTMFCAKQWIDQRRVLWITAEMMADLYNHDLHSRDVAEKAIRKYNAHIDRCNRAIEAGQHGTVVGDTNSDHDSWRAKLEQVTEERNRYLRERDAAQKELDTNRRTLAELSVRLDNVSAKPGSNGKVASSIALNTADPTVVRHINKLQEQIYAERETNKHLKGA
jgi:hypothetical protein